MYYMCSPKGMACMNCWSHRSFSKSELPDLSHQTSFWGRWGEVRWFHCWVRLFWTITCLQHSSWSEGVSGGQG